MNKTELVAAIADKAEISKKDSEKALKAFVDVVTEELKKGHKIQLVGFGTFETSERAAREGRNPSTGETMKIEACKAPKFKAGKAFNWGRGFFEKTPSPIGRKWRNIMRLDKFLKVSRLIKRRTVANEACDAGRVLVNGSVAKASVKVKVGDIIEIQFGTRTVKVEVLDIQETTKKEEAKDLFKYL